MSTLDPKKKKTEKKKDKLHRGADRSKSDSHMQPPPPYVADDIDLLMPQQQGDGWLMPQREYTFETYRPVDNVMHKQDKVKVPGGLNLQQQQYLLQQHWKDKELIENQQKKIIEQKRIISEHQRQIIQQNETHLFFQEQINTLQQQVNSLSNQNQRLSADFSAVRSPMNAASPQSSSSSHNSSGGGFTHSPTPLTSTRGYPLEYPRGVPPPYSTCPPPYHSTSRPIVTDSKTQPIARNAAMMDGKMMGVGNPPMMTSAPERKMLPQQPTLPLSVAGMQQPIPIPSSSSVHLYPLTGGPPLTSAIKVLSPTPSPPTDANQNFFPAKLAPPTSGIHHPLPPTTTAPAYSTSNRLPLEKIEVPNEPFDPLEFQKFADNEVNRLSEADVAAAAAAGGGSDSEIWQLSLPSLDVATGYGVSVNTDEGRGLDIINTNVKSTRCVCVCTYVVCVYICCVCVSVLVHK